MSTDSLTSLRGPEELLSTLVTAITGFSPDQMPDGVRQKATIQCTQMLTTYILTYVREKYGERPTLQLKGIALYDTPELFEKNPQLESMYLEAFDSFVQTIQ